MNIPVSGLDRNNPSFPLLRASVSYSSVTTGAGSAAGLSFIDSNLANEPSYVSHVVKMLSGNAAGQSKIIIARGAVGENFVDSPFTDSAGAVVQIVAGTQFVITSLSGGMASLLAFLSQGLVYKGTVTAVPGANQFTVPELAGFGAGKFDGTDPYYAFVLRDAGGASAAPQNEQQPITAYTTATGVFATSAFTAAVAVGDEILIVHPLLASIGLRSDAATLDDMSALATAGLTAMLKRVLLRQAPNTLSVTIDPGGAARTDFEALWNDIGQMLAGAAGLTTFPASSPAGNGVSIAEVERYIQDRLDAILTLNETGVTAFATTAAEQTVFQINAPVGVFKSIVFKIDTTALTAVGPDSITIRVYERLRAGGGMILCDVLDEAGVAPVYTGVQANPLKVIRLTPNRFGIQITIQRTAGADKTYDMALFSED